MSKLLLAGGVLSAALFITACSPQSGSETSEPAEEAAQVPSTTQPTGGDAMDAMEGKAMTDTNIVETAQAAGTFETLIQAATAAGLAETLSTTQDITVFAPTDDAFAKLPAGTVEGLLENPDELAEILKYHVVSGKVTSDQVVELDSATTLEGSDVSIKTEGSTVMINDATVVQADVMASNGVIHVIDTVLLPE